MKLGEDSWSNHLPNTAKAETPEWSSNNQILNLCGETSFLNSSQLERKEQGGETAGPLHSKCIGSPGESPATVYSALSLRREVQTFLSMAPLLLTDLYRPSGGKAVSIAETGNTVCDSAFVAWEKRFYSPGLGGSTESLGSLVRVFSVLMKLPNYDH